MTTLMALYEKPADQAAFDRYYKDNHLPLVRKLPGLKSVALSKPGLEVLSDAKRTWLREWNSAAWIRQRRHSNPLKEWLRPTISPTLQMAACNSSSSMKSFTSSERTESTFEPAR